MALTKIALGWDVTMAVNAYTPYNRLAVMAGNNWDSNGAFTGWGGFSPSDTTYLADSNRTSLAIIKWLTGKSIGANILVCTDGTGNQDTPTTHDWGNQFQKGLQDAGHVITCTGSQTAFGAYDPLNYDVTCWDGGWTGGSYHGALTANDVLDYILSHKKSLFMSLGGSGATFDRYGIGVSKAGPVFYHATAATYHYGSGSNGPTNWKFQMPFLSSSLGVLSPGGSWGSTYYAFPFYTNYRLYATTNTMGGTSVIEDCGLQSAHTTNGDPEEGVLGLWMP